MLLGFVRVALLNALKSKITRTYGPLLHNNFDNTTWTESFISPTGLSKTLGRIHVRRHKTESSSVVRHDEHKSIFYIDLPGCKATLEYEKKKNVVRILETQVAKSCSGKGYGGLLAKEALNWIAANNLRVIIECDFVLNYVKKNSEFQKYVLK